MVAHALRTPILYQKSGLQTEISRRDFSAAGLSGLSLPDAPCEHTIIRATAANLTREVERLKVRCYARLRIRPTDEKNADEFSPAGAPGLFQAGCLPMAVPSSSLRHFDTIYRHRGRSPVRDRGRFVRQSCRMPSPCATEVPNRQDA